MTFCRFPRRLFYTPPFTATPKLVERSDYFRLEISRSISKAMRVFVSKDDSPFWEVWSRGVFVPELCSVRWVNYVHFKVYRAPQIAANLERTDFSVRIATYV
jgi:hypothetical protein